jgi:NAD(P)-dependent dehydrogenase (short-subunit alcohol dehydrogenase family)
MSIVYLVTGTARGIGLELVRLIASRPDAVVYAGVRDPAKAIELNKIAEKHSNVRVVKLDSETPEDAYAVAKTIEKEVGGLDVVIANAGIAKNWEYVAKVDPQELYDHFKVNTVGPLILFQATYPLLLKHKTRKFITISSLVAMITDMLKEPETAYGTSKAALNFVTKRIHIEHAAEGFITFPMHPGNVATEMGNAAAPVFGLTEFPVAPVDSAKGVLEVVDGATAKEAGRFWNYDGTENRW